MRKAGRAEKQWIQIYIYMRGLVQNIAMMIPPTMQVQGSYYVSKIVTISFEMRPIEPSRYKNI